MSTFKKFVWAFVVSWVLTFPVFAQLVKVPPEVSQKIQTDGVARVIVGLNVVWSPEKTLSESQAMKQRSDIATAITKLKGELQSTSYKVLAEFKYTPGIALEIGPAALQVLSVSSTVTYVRLDQMNFPFLNQSVPLIEGGSLLSYVRLRQQVQI